MSHYEVLGVARDVGASELREGYLTAARTHHPDRHFGDGDPSGTEQRFAKVTRAYEALKDPASQSLPDALRAQDSIGRLRLPSPMMVLKSQAALATHHNC